MVNLRSIYQIYFEFSKSKKKCLQVQTWKLNAISSKQKILAVTNLNKQFKVQKLSWTKRNVHNSSRRCSRRSKHAAPKSLTNPRKTFKLCDISRRVYVLHLFQPLHDKSLVCFKFISKKVCRTSDVMLVTCLLLLLLLYWFAPRRYNQHESYKSVYWSFSLLRLC